MGAQGSDTLSGGQSQSCRARRLCPIAGTRNIDAPMPCPPIEPHASLVSFAPAAIRTLPVFGAPAQLAFLPGRKARQLAGTARPPFHRSPAERIVREESAWSDGALAMTPNRYPFGRDARILWPTEPRREPDVTMWTAVCEWADAAHGTALVNTIGAASTIARAHAHLLGERSPFLERLRERPSRLDVVDVPAGVSLVEKELPFALLGVRGPAAARARTLVRLAAARLAIAWNVVVQDGTAWVFPRRTETPAPHFPVPLGAAEVWGRWCYVDEAPFAAATAADLEAALVAAGTEPLS